MIFGYFIIKVLVVLAIRCVAFFNELFDIYVRDI